ncbi:MAG: copper chaperone PCu(A)C [Xanthobacteraceae bacterium]
MASLRLAAVFLLAATVAAAAQNYRIGGIEITGPWARATPKGATVTAGYMRITNNGDKPDRLLGGRSSVAGAFDIQEMTFAGNVMRLRTLARGLDIQPGQTLDLRPGAPYHFIFAGLSRPLQPGDRVQASLWFERAGRVDIEYAVQPIGSRGFLGPQARAE